MSRTSTVAACALLISFFAAAVPCAVPQVLASGKWDLWDDSADAPRTEKKQEATRPAERAETVTAPNGATPAGGEAKAGDAALQNQTENVVKSEKPVGTETQVQEQAAVDTRKPAVDGQSVVAGPALQPEANAAPAEPAPSKPADGKRKEAGAATPPETVTPAKSAAAVPPEATSGTNKETPSVGSSSGSTGTVPAASDGEYIIGSGDVLDISVWKDEVLSRTVVVLTDGTFTFPLIGKIQAAGRTINQVKSEIVGKLLRYYPEPEVSMEVKQSNSMLIYVIGRVNAPGRQVLNANIDVIQALAMAGGLNPFASRNKIKILRKEGGKTVVLPFRYNDVIEGKVDTNIELKRGDVVVVP